MNATQPSPSPSDSEHEALHRAQRLHEPSMEEILASIRAIIADDRVSGSSAPEPARRPSAPSEPRIVYSNDAPARAFVETAPTPARVEPAPERPAPEAAAPPAVVWSRPKAEPSVEPPLAPIASDPTPLEELFREPESEPDPDPRLLSEEADRSVTASFEALSASVALQSAELLDKLTREMLRPMIKTWLDEHLPSMVERLVRTEIQRVARGGR